MAHEMTLVERLELAGRVARRIATHRSTEYYLGRASAFEEIAANFKLHKEQVAGMADIRFSCISDEDLAESISSQITEAKQKGLI